MSLGHAVRGGGGRWVLLANGYGPLGWLRRLCASLKFPDSMDPIAHTLAGATMAQTRLKQTTPLATATLIIGANAPDIDAVLTLAGSDASLLYRRGLTHGIGALIVLPLVLTALMCGYDRIFRRRGDSEKKPVRPGMVYLLGVLGVASHLFLDWLNTYGIRLLTPFDDRWFYGDLLFIADPWMWLLLAAAAVFAYSGSKISQGLWAALGLLLTAVVLLAPQVPWPAAVVWLVGLATIVAVRWHGVSPGQNQRVALVCLTAVFVYLAATMAGNQIAGNTVVDELPNEPVARADLMSGPVPANPFVREVVAATDTHYYGIRVDLLDGLRTEQFFDPIPIEEPGDVVKQALQDDSIRGFVNWMRFPTYEVRNLDEGQEVIIRDLRYVSPDREDAEFGMVRVTVP